MPFRSQAQQRFAFGTKQPWAKRWAKETDFSTLPKRVKRKTLKAAPCMDCVLASLKGEQIAPGVTRIRGNLCNVHGRYGPCDGVKGGKKPKGRKGRAARKPAKPKQTPEQRAQARAAEQDANRSKVLSQLGIPEDAAGALEDLRKGLPTDDDGGLVKMGLAEQAADGSYRLTPSGRALVAAANSGDPGRARDIISAARDRKAARDARATASAQRHAAADAKRAEAQKKPKGGGGGGKKQTSAGGSGSRGGVTDEERRQERQRREEERQADRAQRQREHQQDRAQRQREHAEDRARREQERQADRQRQQEQRTPAPSRVPQSRTPIVLHGGPNKGTRVRPPQRAPQKRRTGERTGPARQRQTSKAFAVFKDATGAYRWLSRTTTAFEDRDSEVISTKALDDSAASTAPRGPLRFWHMGKPNPLDTAQPWGPGVDLGWCDFAAMEGRTLIESGTFKSEAIARAIAAKADQLELSPGFFHAAGEPDASGVFHHIRIFERSIVPKWAGRASNPYTGLVVEKAMDQKKIEALQTLGVPEATIKELLAEVATTEKAADADGVRYKDEGAAISIVERFKAFLKSEQPKAEEVPAAEPEPAPVADDPIVLLAAELKSLREEVAALKAGPPPMDAEDDPALGGDSGVDEAAEGEPPLDETMMDDTGGGLTLSSEDLTAIGQVIGQVLGTALEPLVGALGIVQKLEGGLGELKTAMSGYTKTKDDERAQLTARLDQQEAQLAELTGDAPRAAGYRASQAQDNQAAMLLEALKESPNGANLDHPFADQTAQWFPNLAQPR